jgi:perosamine synthetase
MPFDAAALTKRLSLVPIDSFLVRDTDTLAGALTALDRNGLGLAFAVDENGRLAGRVEPVSIAKHLTNGGGMSDTVASVTTSARGHTDGISVLTDGDNRPVDLVVPARKRIPVAEPVLGGNELAYVTECIKTNWISSQGPFVKRFESDFAAKIGAEHALAVSNGTVALHLALLVFGIGPGDEVIVPDLTFAASINAIIYTGATPVLVDVERSTWNLCPQATAAAITPRTKAIMPVHLYGQPADMDPIMKLAREHNLKVVEDAAEAVGSNYRGKFCGAIGDAGTFSFFSNKLITTGEGGMVVFRDADAAERARRLRDHGMDPAKRYWHLDVGYNYRLTNMQAALGCAQLEQMDGFLARKLAVARRYCSGLAKVPHLTLPAKLDGYANSYWAFSIIPDMDRLGISRDDFLARLGKAGIDSRPLFYPLHEMPPYKAYAGNREFGATDWLSRNGLSLPSATSLPDGEIDYICGVIARIHEVRGLLNS